MAALIASIVAVLGTLAGTSVTYAFAERTRARDLRHERMSDSRRERLEVYGEFVLALTDFRRVQYDRWARRSEDPSGSRLEEANAESRHVHVAARLALAKVELTARPGLDEPLIRSAKSAFMLADGMFKESGTSSIHDLAGQAQEALDEFTRRAASTLHE